MMLRSGQTRVTEMVRPSLQTSTRKVPSRVIVNASRINPPYNVVVTGGSKGVGRAMAEEFLKAGDTVLICSRSQDGVDSAVRTLAKTYGDNKIKGLSCNVSQPGDLSAVADAATREFGRVDLWINNAGSNAYKFGPLSNCTDSELAEIVQTNVLGVLFGCKEAIRIMKAQPSGGHIFNMDGAGADGSPTPRFAAYGATKRSLAQLTKSLNAELGMQSVKNVGIHNLSPGMVTTELLMAGADNPSSKFFINCLAESPEDAAAFLVPRIRRVPQDSVNMLTGAIASTYIQFLDKPKAYKNIFSRLLTGARKDRYVKEG